MTLLSTRDIETRETIYRIEIDMFDVYQDSQLTFGVSYLHTLLLVLFHRFQRRHLLLVALMLKGHVDFAF